MAAHSIQFPSTKAGLATVGYQLKSIAGANVGSRVTAGVVEIGGGAYGADIDYGSGFVLWDTGETVPTYGTGIRQVDPVAALLDLVDGIETGITPRKALRAILSAAAGKAAGLGGTTATFRDTSDTKNRITATVDADGNRTAVSLDLT